MERQNVNYDRRVRRFIWGAVLLFSLGCGRGLNEPALIEGDSMAPGLVGQHLAIECPECRWTFASEWNDRADSVIVCPNCGCDAIPPANRTIEPGDSVEIQPSELPYRRWDIVAFSMPAADQFAVKRMIGLPGESISIAGGELFADGVLLQKPLSVIDQLKIPVFDAGFLTANGASDRFRADEVATNWIVDQLPLTFDSKVATVDWLTFVPIRGYRHTGIVKDTVPIQDSYAHNQSLNRTLHRINNVWVSFELEFEPDHAADFFVSLESGKNVRVRVFGTSVAIEFAGSEVSIPLPHSRMMLDVAVFDRRLFVLVDDQLVIEEPVEAVDTEIRFGASDGKLSIHQFRVFRDIYWLPQPDGYPDGPANLKAASDEVIVLGDNSPRSLDSRCWDRAGLPVDRIRGVLRQ